MVLLRMVSSHFNLGDVIFEVVSAQSNAQVLN
jgi:Trk-type K+ transport system membrane component